MSRVYTFASVLAVLLFAVVSGCVSPDAPGGPSQPVATTPAFAPSSTWYLEFPTPTQPIEQTKVAPTSQPVGIRQITDNTLSLREYWRKSHMCPGDALIQPGLVTVAGRVACLLPDEARRNGNLRVYDARSGDLMWEAAPATFLGGGELAADGERIYTVDTYTIRAYNLDNGQELWNKRTFPDKALGLYPDGDKLHAQMSMGEAVSCILDARTGDTLNCGSLLLSDGFKQFAQYSQVDLYAHISEYPSTDTVKLRTVDRITQQELWSVDTDLLVIYRPPILVDNVLLIDARRLVAFDAQNGQVLWRSRDFAWGIDGLAANAVVVGRSVYAMGYNARLSQVDPRTGQETGYIQFMPATLPEEYGGACSMATDGQMLFITFGDTEELIALGP